MIHNGKQPPPAVINSHRARVSVYALGLCLIGVHGCASPARVDCPSCTEARRHNHWCDRCNLGYVAGAPIESRALFEALDAHGHDLVPESITCESCRAAMPVDGYCEKCRIGWYRNQAYFSRLTHVIAKGRSLDTARIQCPICRSRATGYGWCEACQRGMIGNFAVTDRKEFDEGCRGYDLMLVAIALSGKCESCALAALTDTECPSCRITYKDGRPR